MYKGLNIIPEPDFCPLELKLIDFLVSDFVLIALRVHTGSVSFLPLAVVSVDGTEGLHTPLSASSTIASTLEPWFESASPRIVVVVMAGIGTTFGL